LAFTEKRAFIVQESNRCRVLVREKEEKGREGRWKPLAEKRVPL
jgi:hypothetical protein